MSDVVGYERKGRIGVITIDNPPVNALSQAVRGGLVEQVARAVADDEAEAVLLICAGRTFIAGADISEFGKPPKEPGFLEVTSALEGSPKPTVAAIHGTAFGGGLETAMSCHYRCAVASAQVGQPEVKLGIIPGAGGTQCLPRLAGVEAATDMIVSGNPVRAPKAEKLGIIDEIVEGDLREQALAYVGRLLDEGAPVRRTRDITIDRSAVPEGFFREYRKKIAKKARGYFAPEMCIQAVEAAVDLPFDEGIQREAEIFVECMTNPQAAALQYVFFVEREAAKIPDVPKDTPLRGISRVGIVGGGTMGGGIAMAFANSGLPVTLIEVHQEGLDRGLATIRKNYERSVASGRFTEAQVEERLDRITGSLSYDDLADADLVVEAVFEDMDLKNEVFGRLDAVCKTGAILATNTSTLDVNEIAAATSRPSDVIGLHFFSPANVMRLLEIVRGAATAKDVLATCMKMTKGIGKVGVVSGVCFGFIGNRMLAGYIREAGLMLLEGASPAQVDAAMYGFGFPMGPFAMGDLAGLDVGYRVRKERGIQPGSEPSSVVHDRLVEMGRHGQKTGAGFYLYEKGSRTPVPDPEVVRIIEEEAARLGIARRELSDEEIVTRCVYPLVNEGARILEEGIAIRPSDIDIVWINGYGFPPYRGGPMYYADQVGLAKVHDAIRSFRERHGEHWEPAPLLAELAEQGDTFLGWAIKKAMRK